MSVIQNMKVRLAVLGVATALLAFVATRVRVSLDLADALPTEGEAGTAFADVRRFALLDTLLIDVDGSGHTPEELHAAVDAIGARLEQRVGSDLASVRYRYTLEDGMALAEAADPSIVVLTPTDELTERLSDAGMARALARVQGQLFGPASALAARQLAHDPLGLGNAFTTRLSATRQAGTQVQGGHLLSADGTHALILARARTAALGTAPDSPLVVHMTEDLRAGPLPADWIGAHRFAAEASAQIQSEISRAVTTGTIGVLLVFLVAFRSVRPLLGTIPPLLVGSVVATAVAALISPIHGIALAFGGALAGMGVDYWIHLYLTGVRDGVKPTFSERLAQGEAALRELMPAYSISVAATVLAFVALATSAYQAVSDLGLIGIGCSFGAFGTIALGGPALFAALARPGDRVPWLPLPMRVPGAVALTLLAGLAYLGTHALNVRFDGDPRSMDARLPTTAALDTAIRARFGGETTQGLVVAEGASLDDALEHLARAVDALGPANGIQLHSPLDLLPAPSQRAARAAAVADPTLSERFTRAADAAGFDAAALLPAFEASLRGTRAPTPDAWAATVGSEVLARTVQTDPDGHVRVAAIVTGVSEAALANAGREMALGLADGPDERASAAPAARFVYPAGVAEAGAERIRSELVSRSGLALLAVLLFMLVRYRDAAKVFAASLPSLAAAVGTLGVLSALGLVLTPVSGPAFVLVLGVAFDQGIFMVEARDVSASDGLGTRHFLAARAAIFIALATAFAGFVALCGASHPAVFGVGVTESLGIGWTALAAFFIVPAVLTEAGESATRRWVRRLSVATVLFFEVDALVAMAGWITPPMPPAGPAPLPPLTGTATDRSVGPNRLIRTHGLWVEHLEGDPYTLGRANATLAGPLQDRNEAGIVTEFYKHVTNPIVQYGLLRAVPLFGSAIDRTLPERYRQELRGYTDIGRDDTFGWIAPHYTRKLCYHAIHDVGQAMVDSPLMGCTGFVASGNRVQDGHVLLARNFDFDGGPSFDHDKAVVAVKGVNVLGFVHVSIVGLNGVVTGLNEQRIGVGVLAAASDARVRLGMPMIFIVREILESARSLDDVQRILDERRGFVSEGILAVDGKTGEAAVFEVTPDDVTRLPANGADSGGGTMALSNHLRGPHANDLANHLRMVEGTTTARLARMEELLARTPVITTADAIAMLRDRKAVGDVDLPFGHESAINADLAEHGAVIDATAGTITVSTAPNLSGAFVTFQIDDLLAGQLEPTVAAPEDDPVRTWRVQKARDLVREARTLPTAAAEANLRRALRVNPGDVDATLALGELLVRTDRAEEATPLLEAVLARPERAEQARAAKDGL